MNPRQVNYEQIAGSYHQRYAASPHAGTAAALAALVQERDLQRVLEVGCGTGRWLIELEPLTASVIGLDLSPGMLQEARKRRDTLRVVRGHAQRLPFAAGSFDFVLCANALHHFETPQEFVAEARRLLHSGGVLAVVGMTPPADRDQWYLYRYFEGTHKTDLQRYPAWSTVQDWLAAAGFAETEFSVVERIDHQWTGEAVLSDPFLKKGSTSQLALLSDEAYTAGLQKLKTTLGQASANAPPTFDVHIVMGMLVGLVR